jgi:hypothetical protein
MKRAAVIYNILVLSIFLTAGMINAQNPQDFFTAMLFAPPLIYFCRLLVGNLKPYSLSTLTTDHQPLTTNNALTTVHQPLATTQQALDPEVITDPGITDVNRRLFLKLVGGAGMSVFMMSIFTDRAHAAFFGSMPVPGAMTIKDSTGAAIDPAEKQPTDGYEISEIDDTTSPAYYGFVHKTGAWYISREDDSGSYRYAKGLSDFPTAWTNRATHTYDYFDNVF